MKRRDQPLPCHYCEEPDADTEDHVVPKAVGGPRAGWNMVPCCGLCNGLKADTYLPEHCAFCVAAWDRFLVIRAAKWAAGQGVYTDQGFRRRIQSGRVDPPPLPGRGNLAADREGG